MVTLGVMLAVAVLVPVDAASIVVVRVDTVAPTAWKSAEAFERTRTVALSVVVDRVLKGPLKAGDKAKIKVEQRQATGRIHAVAGAWSKVELEPKRKYVVFSKAATGGLASALTGDSVIRVAPESEVADIALMVELDKVSATPSTYASRVNDTARAALGVAFGEYLIAKAPNFAPLGAAEWEALIRFVEHPANGAAFRPQGVRAVVEGVLMHAPAPEKLVVPTVRFAFRQLASTSDAGLKQRLTEVYLPNLLGESGAEVKRGPAAIFGDAAERTAAEAGVQKQVASPAKDLLLAWFRK